MEKSESIVYIGASCSHYEKSVDITDPALAIFYTIAAAIGVANVVNIMGYWDHMAQLLSH